VQSNQRHCNEVALCEGPLAAEYRGLLRDSEEGGHWRVQAQRLLLATREILEAVQIFPSHIAVADDLGYLSEKLCLDIRVGRDFEEEGRHGRGGRFVPRNQQ
jgi:hypothetical protein